MTSGTWSIIGSYSVYGDSARKVAAIEYEDGRYKLWIRESYWIVYGFYDELATAKAVACMEIASR